jgi:ABC-type branched-subunit amino acid transport system ATPase component
VREHGLARNPVSAELVKRPTVTYSSEFQTLHVGELAALVRAAADRGAVLDGGRVALEGSGAELLADPRMAELYLGGAGPTADGDG